jgi:small subunit ribosomal protein S17
MNSEFEKKVNLRIERCDMAVQSRKKVFIGKVVSNKMQKTVAVTVERRYKHPLYGKYVKRSSRFLVHDEKNASTVGDTVRIVETRPLSRRKCWRLVEVIEKAK